MRSTFLLLLIIFPAVAAVNAVVLGARLQRFLREVKRLESTADIERYKKAVAEQMYAALVQIALLAAPVLLFLYGIVKGILTGSDVLFIIVPSVVILLLGLAYKPVESAARQIPTADEELSSQRDEITKTWTGKAFPDW
ncbi:MAG: hypothetical protein GY906_00325 [bacterium]|nr:hypothetical protein [bacterium]